MHDKYLFLNKKIEKLEMNVFSSRGAGRVIGKIV